MEGENYGDPFCYAVSSPRHLAFDNSNIHRFPDTQFQQIPSQGDDHAPSWPLMEARLDGRPGKGVLGTYGDPVVWDSP